VINGADSVTEVTYHRNKFDYDHECVILEKTIVFHSRAYFFLPTTRQNLVGKVMFINEVSQTHSDTPRHSVELLRMSDRPDTRDLYLTTQNTHNKQPSIHQARFESAIPASERQKNQALDRAVIEISSRSIYVLVNVLNEFAGKFKRAIKSLS
jgi:hypothetical protein